MKYHIVTSFNSKIWHKYASKTIGTFFQEYSDLKDDDFEFMIWMDTNAEAQQFLTENPLPEHFKFVTLDQLPQFIDFQRRFDGGVPLKERGMDMEKIHEGMRFKWNYMPFAKKVYSWAFAYLNIPENDVLVWVDADIILNRRLTKGDLDKIVSDFDVVFLDRDFPMYAAETGFFTLRRTPQIDTFVQLMLQVYSSGFLFDMAEWHDGYVFKTVMKMVLNSGIKVANLNPCLQEMNIFERTILSDFMTHYKGPALKKQLRGDDIGVNPELDTMIEFDPEQQGYE